MTATTIRVQMAQRKDTAANWTSANPILLSGEIGYETDTKKFKIGNGSSNWNSLAYLPIPDGSGNLTITGNLEIGSTGSLTFEGSTADGFETTLAVTNPTADRTITLPDRSGTVITSGDTGTVTSTMLADGTIVNADISATAEIAVSKLANGTANQIITTDGTDVSWSSNLNLAGNATIQGDLTVNGTTTTIDTQTLLVEDKNIEMGVVATPTDVTADGGGITLRGTTNKTINWIDSTDSWTSSEHVDLASGKSYRINNTEVLSSTTLGSGVTASSLTSVGTLGSLTVSGSATAASFIPTSSTAPTNGVYLPAANSVAISTNGTKRIEIQADGDIDIDGGGVFYDATNNRLAIGTTSPASIIHASGSSGSIGLRVTSGSSSGEIAQNGVDFYVVNTANGPTQFWTNGSERARIDSSGRLLVGTSSALAASTLTPGFQHHKANTSDANAGLGRWTNDVGGYAIYFNKSRGTDVGTQSVVLADDFLGALFFEGSDGTQMRRGAAITAHVDGTPGANDMPGRLVFSTTADGASSPTERFRITNDGVKCYEQPAPTSKSAAATLTVAELKTGIIQYTGAAATLTLPTGTLTEGGFSGVYTNMTFEWSVINTGSGTCTIGGGTGHTIVGAATVTAGASGRFASRRTAANTFVSYRLS